MLSTLLIQIKLLYGQGRATCTVHCTVQDQPGRKRVYHYIKEAKILLPLYIYCTFIRPKPTEQCAEVAEVLAVNRSKVVEEQNLE